MKNIYKFFSLLYVAFIGVSCEDPDASPIFYYEDLENGAYIRLVVKDSGDLLIDINEPNSFSHSYVVEFVDAGNGSTVQSYSVDVDYISGTDTSTVENFRMLSASDFSLNSDGFYGNSVNFTSKELIDEFGISASSLKLEDKFLFRGEIKTPTRTFNSGNSSATVKGSFFQGYFDFTVFVGCPSNLTGKYATTTTAITCNSDSTGSSSVRDSVIISKGGNIAIGEYTFDDWSFGVLDDCFDEDEKIKITGFEFEDVCGEVAFTFTKDDLGINWTYSSVISGNNWVITWENPDIPFRGTTEVNFPEGVPFTVK